MWSLLLVQALPGSFRRSRILPDLFFDEGVGWARLDAQICEVLFALILEWSCNCITHCQHACMRQYRQCDRVRARGWDAGRKALPNGMRKRGRDRDNAIDRVSKNWLSLSYCERSYLIPSKCTKKLLRRMERNKPIIMHCTDEPRQAEAWALHTSHQ